MAIPLVYMFPNSTTLVLAGNWNNSPGDKRMNKATATTTGPQSALILFSLCRFLSTLMEVQAFRVLLQGLVREDNEKGLNMEEGEKD